MVLRALGVFAAVFLVSFLATAESCGSPTTEVNTASSASASTGTTNSQTTAKPLAHVGASLRLSDETGKTFSVTLSKIMDPAQPGDQFTTPDNGKRFVAVVLVINDNGQQAIDEGANNDVSVIGSDNQTYNADFNNVAGCTNFNEGQVKLGAGESATGCVVFQLPSGVSVAKVQFSPSSGFSNQFGEWLVP
jgi:hypothetical protein